MINPSSDVSHCVSSLLDVPAGFAFSFMADPIALGGWSLGCMNTRPTGSGAVHTGHSLFDGGQAYFEIDADPRRMIVDYRLGVPGRMEPRISARVLGADVCGLRPDQCYVTLTAWRTTTMDDTRWHGLCVAHEAEILLIRAQCERAWRAAGPAS